MLKVAEPPEPSFTVNILPEIDGLKVCTVFTEPVDGQLETEQVRYCALAL